MADSRTEQKAVSVRRSGIIFVVITASLALSSLVINPAEYDLTLLKRFITFLLGMLIQAFPFLLAGTLVSSALHFFVSDRFLERVLAKSTVRAIPAALLASVAFPVCDCASVPVASRLMRKGIPLPAVITYMLASPILNPVVLASTFFAFPDRFGLCAGRIVLGLVIPVSIGLILGKMFTRAEAVRTVYSLEHGTGCSCGCHSAGEHVSSKIVSHPALHRLRAMLAHAGEEFITVSPYIIAGAAISSLVQVAVPREALGVTSASSRFFIHPLIMIAAALLLSVCSTSDAFIARGFSSAFSSGSVLAFMTAGPMIDVKNILMMLPYFRKRLIAALVVLVVLFTYAAAVIASFFFFGAA
jgi:uncharacterized membrane protein YraQ (UPF0718 family)